MQREMNLLEIIKAFIKRFNLLIIIVLIAGILGGGISFLLNDKLYESTATVIVGEETQKETDQFNQINGEPIYEEVIVFGESSISGESKKFYSETLNRQDLLTAVIDNLDLNLSWVTLRESTEMRVPEDSSSLFITVRLEESENVDIVVDEIVSVFMEKVYEITEMEKLKVINSASEPALVDSVNVVKIILLSIGIGFAVSFVVILVLEYLDDSIESIEDITEKLDLPVLGIIENESAFTENIKQVRTQIEYSSNLKDRKVFSVASVSEDSKNISVDLAKALQKTKNKVLLIDADLRNPTIHENLNISNEFGLSNVLENEMEYYNENILQQSSSVYILTAGTALDNPSEKLTNSQMHSFINKVKESFDYIIINGHSLVNVTDTIGLSRLTDVIILIIEENKTKISELEKAKESLENIGVKKITTIYNKI